MALHPSQQISFDSFRNSVAVSVGGGDVTLQSPCRAFYVGGAGAVALRLVGDLGAGGADVTFLAMIPGTIYYLRVAIFRQTSTTATGIVALY